MGVGGNQAIVIAGVRRREGNSWGGGDGGVTSKLFDTKVLSAYYVPGTQLGSWEMQWGADMVPGLRGLMVWQGITD